MPEGKIRVLFVCGHNSARSQMAEIFLETMGKNTFAAESAGLDLADQINPLVVEAMKEIGFDLEGKGMQRVMDLYERGREYDFVIAVCDAAKAGQCPVFPGTGKGLHWPFEDPASLEGSWEERLARTREIRDAIRKRIELWIEELGKEGTLEKRTD